MHATEAVDMHHVSNDIGLFVLALIFLSFYGLPMSLDCDGRYNKHVLPCKNLEWIYWHW